MRSVDTRLYHMKFLKGRKYYSQWLWEKLSSLSILSKLYGIDQSSIPSALKVHETLCLKVRRQGCTGYDTFYQKKYKICNCNYSFIKNFLFSLWVLLRLFLFLQFHNVTLACLSVYLFLFLFRSTALRIWIFPHSTHMLSKCACPAPPFSHILHYLHSLLLEHILDMG